MAKPKPKRTMARITLYVPQQAWRQFRAQCIEAGISASQVIAADIQDRLKGIDVMSVADEEPTHADA